MAEPDSTTDSTTIDTGASATDDTSTSQPADLGDAGKKALDAERTARRAAEKQARDLAAQLKTLGEVGKTDMEKLTARLDSAEKHAAESAREAMRLRVGAEHKLPKEITSRLRGDTEEEMTADAAVLAELVRQRSRPAGDVDQGQRGTRPAQSPAQEFAALFANR